jgi:hypothetical protein
VGLRAGLDTEARLTKAIDRVPVNKSRINRSSYKSRLHTELLDRMIFNGILSENRTCGAQEFNI